MSDAGLDAQARLDAWRAQGGDRADPVHAARIEALARRAVAEHGAVRRLLDARLAELIDACGREPEARAASAGSRADGARPRRGADASLSTLVDRLAREAAVRSNAAGSVAAANATDMARAAFDDVLRLSARARTESQLRQALVQTSEDAGPLNSDRLVHRTLAAMRDASPDCLRSFLGYIDTLAWLDELGLAGEATGGAPAVAARATRPARGKARARRK